MADKQKIAIIGITLLLSSILSTFVISLDRSLILNVDLENPTVVQYAQGNNSTMDVGNFSRGGYHLATGEWWEQRMFNVSTIDSDGDGVPNSNDSHPLDPALPPVDPTRASLCFVDGLPCTNEPTSTVMDTSEWISSNSLFTSSVAWGDVDGDGDLDLAVGNRDGPVGTVPGSNEIFINTGTALATTPAWTSSNSLSTTSVAWGDVDGDGDLDLAVGNWNGNNEVYLNTGTTLATTPAWTSSNSLGTNSVAWGDVDGDGDLDLAVGNSANSPSLPSYNEVYLNTGTTLATTPVWTSSNDLSTLAISWGDVDGDGDLDLAVGNAGPSEIYLNTGTTLATTPAWTTSTWRWIYSVAWGDVDGDGDLDLAMGGDGYDEVYLNTGTALATTPAWTSSNSLSTKSVAWGDVDGDGDLDLAIGSTGINEVYLNSGTALATTPAWTSSNDLPTFSVAWGDVDGDGGLDLAVGNSGINEVYLNSGTALATTPDWTSSNSLYTYSVAWGDVDGDGDIDLAVGNRRVGSCCGNEVYLNDGTALATTPIWISDNSQDTFSVAWGDVDGDGDLDLAVGNIGNNEVYLNNGTTLAITPAWTSSNSLNTYSVAWGDVDGDGDLDLAVGNGGNNEVYLNSGTALATTPVWTSSNSLDTYSVAWGDVDGDGDLDLAVGNNGGNNEVYLNSGTALATTPAWTSSNSLNTYSVAWGDVDGDGDLDLAVGNSYIPWVSTNQSNEVYLNNGTALATTPYWTSSNSLSTTSVAWGDVDGDGDLDLAVGNYFDGGYGNWAGNNEVYLNNGTTLAITPAWTSNNSLHTYSVAWGDLDGDGGLDLAVGNRLGNNEIYNTFSDADGDWFTDDNDEFIFDPTQSADSDGDGYGDNPQGRQFDSCMGDWGDSWRDRWGCPDLDKDGQSDLYDDYINKPTQWSDSDGDGLGDNWGDVSINATRPTYWPGQWLDSAYNPDPSPLDFDNDGKEDEGLNGSQGPFDDCPYTYGTSTIDRVGCIDSDSDGFSDPDSNWGVLDGADNFPAEQTQWNDSDGDGFGDNQAGKDADAYPDDPTQWADFDGDGHGDNPNGTNADAFSFEPTQWDDRDGDGYGDNPSPAFQPDACPDIAGTSTRDGYGCLDADGDGWGLTDDCPEDAGNSTVDRTGCIDIDGDGWSSVGDYDQDDPNVWSNLDGDEYPDQGNSTTLDSCPSEFGTSWLDRLGCADPDGDGWSSADGVWFTHPLGSADSHPNDGSQWRDRDGDGYGDNQTGSNPDACPDLNGESEWTVVNGERIQMLGCADADGDGYTDDIDNCLIIAGSSQGLTWGCPDSDDDGTQDLDDDCPSQLGTSTANLKACPDSDNDGIADLEDPFPLTPLLNNATSTDWDGDGYANANDSFVFDETQWNDTDGDGLGDEPTGNNPDPYPNDRDNDAWDDPNDLTTDDQGCLEKPESGKDAFPTDKREWLDSDGDCIGNNADTDDDNDGWTDTDEIREDTDPLDPDDYPVKTFQLVIPGTTIGLDAWDLIGIFGGFPIFGWILFGFVTRNTRARKFEEQLHDARSKEELEAVAVKSEYALMLRLIGAHQGIRIERLRAELDDEMAGETHHVPEVLEPEDITEDQTHIVEHEMHIAPTGPQIAATGVIGGDGYEWLEHNGVQYYRSPGSDDGWNKWEN